MKNLLLKFATVTTVVTVSSLSASNAEAATFNFFDGTFNEADWTRTFAITQGPFSPVSETAEQRLSEGNPGSFRFMSHTWGGGTQILAVHLSNIAVYTPSTQGAIDFINYSADTRGFGGLNGVFGDGLIIVQEGRVFASAFTAVNIESPWQTKSFSGLTSDDFIALGGGDAPDFSELGAPIRFGYIRTNTIAGPVSTVQHGIDNWNISVTTVSTTSVPESRSVLGLLTVGAFSASSVLKRKQKQ